MRSPFTIIIGVLCVHCLAEEITPAPLPEPVVEAVSKAETALLKARQEYESANKIVLERTTRSLEKYVRTATQEGNITSAMETQQLIEDMQAGIFLINFNQKYFSNSLLLGEEEQVISPVKVIPVVIDGTKKIGCEVGPVSKGQYFVLQYM